MSYLRREEKVPPYGFHTCVGNIEEIQEAGVHQ